MVSLEKKGGKDFVDAAADHGRFTLSGDLKSCNKAYNKIVSAATYLRILPDKGEAVLVELLNYPDDSVKSWAAAYLLPTRSEVAIKTLKEIAGHPGLIAFSAAVTLKEWLAGRLRLP